MGARPLAVALLIRKWSTRGGNELVATQVAQCLHDKGHDVRVFCQRVDDSAQVCLPTDRIVRLAGVSFDPTLAMLSFAARTRTLMRRLRTRGEIDVVLGFNHSVEHDVYRLGAGTHAEFMARTQDGLGRSGGPVLNRVALSLERVRFKPENFRRLIAPSEMVRDEIIRHYRVEASKIDVVYNGTALDRFTPLGADRERGGIRAEWGVDADEPIAIFAGQDLVRKGFNDAVEATRKANCKLVYIGKARRPASLPEHVVWGGERGDVPACFRAADAFVLPTHYEPFGNVILEAYACGLPVISTRRAGGSELARGSELDSLIVDAPTDHEGMARALIRVFADQPRWREMARTAAAGYDLSAFGDRIEAVLAAARSPRQ